MKYVLSILSIGLISYIAYASLTEADQSLLDKTIEFNNQVYTDCFINGSGAQGISSGSLSDTRRYREATDCWKSQRKLTPDDLFLTVPKYLVDERKCSISQTEDDHVKPERGGMYATDLACNFKEQGVYAPDYLDQMIEYKIESIWFDNLLGNFVILSFKDWQESWTRWYFGHTVLDSNWKVWDVVRTWIRFAKADLSGATTGWHTHIELRRMYDGVWQSVRYVTRGKERRLEEKRNGTMGSSGITNPWGTGWNTWGGVVLPFGRTPPLAPDNQTKEHQFNLTDTFYFTHYTLGDVNQNDGDPCISADGKDSCAEQKKWRWTMALTVDLRDALWIKLWDKVVLAGDIGCEGVYTVTDEMACRYRGINAYSWGPCYYSDKVTPAPKNSNVYRPKTPYYIKGDLPWRPGGACSISKL